MRLVLVLALVAACGPTLSGGRPTGSPDLAVPVGGDDAGAPPGDLAMTGAHDDLSMATVHDFAKPPPDLTPPPPKPTTTCGAMTCTGSTSSCCVGITGGRNCIVPGGSCQFGTEYACDGSSDCKSTEECCEDPSGSRCQPVGNCGTRLCRTHTDCFVGDYCCPTDMAHLYQYCAQLCPK